MATTPFLFQSLQVTPRLSARKIHICRLYDVVQLSLLKNDLSTAKRAWAILARCKEMDWKTMWPIAVRILGNDSGNNLDTTRKIDFLRELLIERSEQKELILKEIVLRQILAGKYRDALDDLELYLPSFPYQDDPVLHTYAGLLCLYLSQSPEDATAIDLDQSLLHTARTHFRGAKSLDPENTVAEHFQRQIARLSGEASESGSEDEDDSPSASDEAMDIVETEKPLRKRVRT